MGEGNLSAAATAQRATNRHPGISPDGMWYWDGRGWHPTTTNDGNWRWDGYRWMPLTGRRAKAGPSGWLLLCLLVLDLGGFVPGVGLASAAAAAVVLLMIDARGLVTLNGLIRWRRMSFGMKLLAAFLEIVLFQFVVLVYIGQRFLGFAKAPWKPARNRASTPVALREAVVKPQAPARPSDADAMKSVLDNLVADAKTRLPSELMDRLRVVVDAIVDLLPAYSAGQLAPHDRFVVERTVEDYLPSALSAYLKIPIAYRSSPLHDAEGKTASQVLSDQLDLLRQRMAEVADAAYTKDAEPLLIHGRFLRSKFGASSLNLKN